MVRESQFGEDEAPAEAMDMFEDYLRKELKASETMERLGREYSVEEITKASDIVIRRVINNVEDLERKKRLWIMFGRVGESIGSEYMMQQAQQALEEMVQG